MEAIIERCCGMDVHRDTIAACLLTGKADERPTKTVRTFGTMSHELRELAQWLRDADCTHVAMESTGVYWMAPCKALEMHFELIVGNAKHLAKVPGRKTDVLDSEWIAELLRHGLIRKSFIPPPPIRELRDLTRYRRKLVQSRSGERNRLQKMLETANIKLASVMSDVFGVSGSAILRALVEGELTPKQMAGLARGQLRKKMRLLTLALDAPFEDHHRYLLRTQLGRLDQLDCDIAEAERRIAEKLEPYREQYERLMQIPGVKAVAASVLIAELGVDMSVFTSPGACASWAGVSPGNNESAGKRKSGRISRGNPHLKPILLEAARAASRKKDTYLRDKYHKIRSRRGDKRATVAIAHKIVIAAYHMLATGEDYRELGEGYLDTRHQQRLTRRLVARLEALNLEVTLKVREPSADARPTTPDGTDARVKISRETAGGAADESGMTVEQTTAPAGRAGHSAPSADSPSNSHDPEPAPTPFDTASLDNAEAEFSTGSDERDAPSSNVVPSSNVAPSSNVVPSSSVAPKATREPDDTTLQSHPVSQGGLLKRSRRRHAKPRRQKSGPRDPRLPPSGTTLTRTFKGVEYQVLVLDDGFEYSSQFFASITGAAKAITGTSGSGFAFFGLKQPFNMGKDTP